MRHLTPETLARLVDEAPGAAEAAHLEACDDCRAELDAVRAQTAALGRLPDPEPPTDGWDRLATRLDAEGLLDDHVVPRRRRGPGVPGSLRWAAAVAFFLFGGLTGFVLRGATAPAGGVAAVDGDAPAIAVESADTPDEAARALLAAESTYRAALARFSELSGEASASDPVARLAALQGIVLTTREALRQAPADPLINGYHLAAAAQRDAMIRQLALEDADPWF